MTEAECKAVLEEDLALLDLLMENSRKQMRKLAKRLWSGITRLSRERDLLLERWVSRREIRRLVFDEKLSSLQSMVELVKRKSDEVEQLHSELFKEAQMEKNLQALQLQRFRQSKSISMQYQGALPKYSGRCNIKG